MSSKELKAVWLEKFVGVPQTLEKVKNVKRVSTAFNTAIDAVFKIKPAKLLKLIEQEGLSLKEIQDIRESKLNAPADVIKGLFRCFTRGIAEEWMTEDVKIYEWMVANLGYDRLQVGGQGGIIANALAAAGVKEVFVHCNSLPKLQAEQFLELDNLLSFDENGKAMPAYQIDRKTDIPLIHWIIEFDKGDVIELDGEKFICPKANRFIATYDPLNLNLVMDKGFVENAAKKDMDYIVLSGYHALNADNKGVELVEGSISVLESWKRENTIIHLEIASTQDLKVRKAIVSKIAPLVDSVGVNERETIDVMEIIGEKELAEVCDKDTHSVNLFKALIKMKQKLKTPRIQLHMFGLYIIIQNKGFKITPQAALRGMCVAATAAASKAGTGAITSVKDMLWAMGREVSDIGLKELKDLAEFLGDEAMKETGISSSGDFDIIAIPTIIIEKPLTLVGMGDTISSLSLVPAV